MAFDQLFGVRLFARAGPDAACPETAWRAHGANPVRRPVWIPRLPDLDFADACACSRARRNIASSAAETKGGERWVRHGVAADESAMERRRSCSLQNIPVIDPTRRADPKIGHRRIRGDRCDSELFRRWPSRHLNPSKPKETMTMEQYVTNRKTLRRKSINGGGLLVVAQWEAKRGAGRRGWLRYLRRLSPPRPRMIRVRSCS